MIENTGQRDPLLHLLGAMQKQLLASCDLPTMINGGTEEEFTALGFTFGAAHPHDPMFRPATLPEGWRRDGSDHAMWSYVLDQLGRRRVSIFYKAAFYDRDAFMSLVSVAYVVADHLYGEAEPVLDDEWCTAAAISEAARFAVKGQQETVELYTRRDVADRDPDYAAHRLAEARQRIAKAEALIARVSQ